MAVGRQFGECPGIQDPSVHSERSLSVPQTVNRDHRVQKRPSRRRMLESDKELNHGGGEPRGCNLWQVLPGDGDRLPLLYSFLWELRTPLDMQWIW